jgi:molybdopterin/thiamine biosynthesis adenylyltransferase
MDFTENQLERYSRHIILKDVGIEGQEKILSGSVLIIGAGGLGAPIALYLAAAGVGRIGIADFDKVELSNLQRQVIHFTSDIGKRKVDSAVDKMNAINPDIETVAHGDYLNSKNIQKIIRGYDFVIDGTDNFASKFLINDACVFENKPFSHGGILRFDGQTMTIIPNISPCYRCAFHEPPPANAVPTCSQAGVLGSVAGMLGTIQATEALKFLTGAGDLLTGRLLMFDAKTMRFRTAELRKNPNCPVCGDHPSITELLDGEQAICDLKQ